VYSKMMKFPVRLPETFITLSTQVSPIVAVSGQTAGDALQLAGGFLARISKSLATAFPSSSIYPRTTSLA